MRTTGEWVVLRMGYSLTGAINNPAAPEASGFEVDKLSRTHVSAYMDEYLRRLETASGGSNPAEPVMVSFGISGGLSPISLPMLISARSQIVCTNTAWFITARLTSLAVS